MPLGVRLGTRFCDSGLSGQFLAPPLASDVWLQATDAPELALASRPEPQQSSFLKDVRRRAGMSIGRCGASTFRLLTGRAGTDRYRGIDILCSPCGG